jgi:hypothetical protein
LSDIAIILPVYNDWAAFSGLMGNLDAALGSKGRKARVLVVDDGSTEAAPTKIQPANARAIHQIECLKLRRNVGHQRAICIGLAYLEEHWNSDTIVVMDADGEDDPDDLLRMLDRWDADGGSKVVFAERRRRSESLVFRFCYFLYRLAHRALVGRDIRVGNFSVLARRHLRALVVTPELWAHYAASVFVARLPTAFVPTNRASRLAGRSGMNFVALVVHGLSALAVWSDIVATRVVTALAALAAASGGLAVAVIVIRLFTDRAIPGWASQITGLAVLLLTQSLVSAVVFVFVVLNGKKGLGFLPVRDYHLLVDTVVVLA